MAFIVTSIQQVLIDYLLVSTSTQFYFLRTSLPWSIWVQMPFVGGQFLACMNLFCRWRQPRGWTKACWVKIKAWDQDVHIWEFCPTLNKWLWAFKPLAGLCLYLHRCSLDSREQSRSGGKRQKTNHVVFVDGGNQEHEQRHAEFVVDNRKKKVCRVCNLYQIKCYWLT